MEWKRQGAISRHEIESRVLRETFHLLPVLDLGFFKKMPEDLTRLSLGDLVPAILYVGRGSHGRSYQHLVEAKQFLLKRRVACSRIARIIASLWSEGGKVVILQFEHNSSLEEVQSREASLISAIGKQNLANVLCGTYKGSCREWSFMERAGMGVIILQRVNRSIRNDPTLIKAFSSSVTISTCTFGARFHLKKRRTAPSK
ncbi:hypothetical protein PMAYCL1PPCAC_23994 [Pristionchus mayeri]|uniref:Uncharacterized protein n=1 Tax=Pristionchus mayeri TaxID=1317129 RepID=A0AAN5D1B1_9BILA|nr:hypothetical protein PMAYCL1PPCAC_23994 [Pristionchus mayeri]